MQLVGLLGNKITTSAVEPDGTVAYQICSEETRLDSSMAFVALTPPIVAAVAITPAFVTVMMTTRFDTAVPIATAGNVTVDVPGVTWAAGLSVSEYPEKTFTPDFF